MPNWKIILSVALVSLIAGIAGFSARSAKYEVFVPAAADRQPIVASGVKIPAKDSAVSMPASVRIIVPFAAQAPFANWKDLRQETGCEEASAVMAMRWVRGETLSSAEALSEITAISDYELKKYGYYADTSAKDTVDIIFREYFKYGNIALRYGINSGDIRKELAKNHLVIIPANGRALGNPHYVAPGPLHHMLLVTGYDDATQQFITNDPGTRYGENYRYSYKVLDSALEDYESGNNEPLKENRTAMIVVAMPDAKL